MRFAAQELEIPSEDVTSPTYVLLQRYRGTCLIYHFDFYRLNSAAEVWDLGIDDLLAERALTIFEWASKFPECLPTDRLTINFSVADQTSLVTSETLPTQRFVQLEAGGVASRELLEEVASQLVETPELDR